jgi:hypothetical protein
MFIAIRLKMEKEKSDSNPKYHIKWSKYFSKQWDDMAFSIFAGLGLVAIQEPVFFGWAKWAEKADEWAIDFYFDSEEAIAFAMGLFGSAVVMAVFKWVLRKAAKLNE